jgi:hypothetical protein
VLGLTAAYQICRVNQTIIDGRSQIDALDAPRSLSGRYHQFKDLERGEYFARRKEFHWWLDFAQDLERSQPKLWLQEQRSKSKSRTSSEIFEDL